MSGNEKPFVLKGMDDSFLQRQKNVFEQLNQPPKGEVQEATRQKRKKPTAPMPKLNRLRGKESIFKRPPEPIFNKHSLRQMPDFKKNPHKWKRYSLADVNEDQMSDKSNTSAAMAFLNELQNRRKNEANEMEQESGTQKIVFKKRTSRNEAEKDAQKAAEEDKVSFRSSKVIMPEYVVGQKKNNLKKKSGSDKAIARAEALKLGHLYQDEDEDEAED